MNNFFKNFLGKPQDSNGILTPKPKAELSEKGMSRRSFLAGSGKLVAGAAIANVGLGFAAEEVQAAPNMELRKELIDNRVIFTNKSDIIAAFEKYENGRDMTAFNFYYPRYIGEQNPNISRLSKSLIKRREKVTNLDNREVAVPLLEGESIMTLNQKMVVKAEIVGGSGWVILAERTQIIIGKDGKKMIAACRNEIFEEIKEEEKKCIPKCEAVLCNYPETIGGVKTGKVVSVKIPFSKEKNSEPGRNICQTYMESNLSAIKAKFNELK